MLRHNKRGLPSHPLMLDEALYKRMVHCWSGHNIHSCGPHWNVVGYQLKTIWIWISQSTVVIVAHKGWLRTAISSAWTCVSNSMVLAPNDRTYYLGLWPCVMLTPCHQYFAPITVCPHLPWYGHRWGFDT